MTATIKLEYPITADGRTLDELTLRRPKVRDLEKAQKHKDEFTRSVHMIADLAEISPDAVRDMDAGDFTRIAQCVGECVGASD